LSKSSPQVPTPANPTTVSNAQTTSNLGTSAAQQAENNVNQVGPNGSTTYNQTGSYTDPTTGTSVPTYTQTNTLDPLSQAILTGTKQVGASLIPTAQTLAGQAGQAATTPLNFNTADSGILNSSPTQIDQNAAKASFDTQAGFLKPVYDQQQKDLQDQLSRAGIPVGADAYNSAETNLGNTQNQGLTAASNNAVAGGANSASQLFNMAQLGQNQNIGQQQLAQSNPLALLSQIYGGTGGSA
jgi:hypothetical protein